MLRLLLVDNEVLIVESLNFIFQAYSLVDREVGYCQGSAFIVGLLLMQVKIFKNM